MTQHHQRRIGRTFNNAVSIHDEMGRWDRTWRLYSQRHEPITRFGWHKMTGNTVRHCGQVFAGIAGATQEVWSHERCATVRFVGPRWNLCHRWHRSRGRCRDSSTVASRPWVICPTPVLPKRLMPPVCTFFLVSSTAKYTSASRVWSTRKTWGTGTAGAALGGVTAICEMPNTKPSTTTAEDLAEKSAGTRKGLDRLRFLHGRQCGKRRSTRYTSNDFLAVAA